MQHVPVMLVLFDPTEDMQRTGNVTRIDMQLRSIKLEYDDDFDWFRFEDIIGAFA